MAAPIITARAGFKLNETLASNLKFSGIVRIWEVNKTTKHTVDDEFDYWTIKDEYGARMSCYDEKLSESVIIGERYAVSGEIKIGKGGTFLNLKKAESMNGSQFRAVNE